MEQFSWLSKQDYQVLIDHLQDGIFVIEDEKFTYVNQRLADMFGYPVDELIGRPFIELVASEDISMVSERHRARVSGKKVPDLYDIHISTGHGTTICCSLNVGVSKNHAGHTVAIGSVRDVTQQKAALAELQASKEEMKSILERLPDVFYRTNMDGIITMISSACFDIIGYRPEEMLGRALSSYYYTPVERQKAVQAITEAGGKVTQVESALKRKDGSIVWVSTNASIRYGPDGKPTCIEGVARDISERKRMEEQLVTISRTDALTGIYTRRHFLDKSEKAVKVMKRYKHSASMIVADLDNFKKINDRYGHQAGDQALIAFAEVCRKEIRDSDILGRLGGEEFALLLPETPLSQARILAERIRKATAAVDILLKDRVIKITVSIGVAEIGTDERPLESALHRADLAMYQAKESGRNRVVVSADSD